MRLLLYEPSDQGQVLKCFSCSSHLSMKFIQVINVKIVGILTFMSRINDWLWRFKHAIAIDFGYFSIYEQDKTFATSGPLHYLVGPNGLKT